MTQKRTWTFLNNCNTVLEYGFEIILTLTCANTQQSSVLTTYVPICTIAILHITCIIEEAHLPIFVKFFVE